MRLGNSAQAQWSKRACWCFSRCALDSALTAHSVPVARWRASDTRPKLPVPITRPTAKSARRHASRRPVPEGAACKGQRIAQGKIRWGSCSRRGVLVQLCLSCLSKFQALRCELSDVCGKSLHKALTAVASKVSARCASGVAASGHPITYFSFETACTQGGLAVKASKLGVVCSQGKEARTASRHKCRHRGCGAAGRAAWSASCSAARSNGRGTKALSLARAI